MQVAIKSSHENIKIIVKLWLLCCFALFFSVSCQTTNLKGKSSSSEASDSKKTMIDEEFDEEDVAEAIGEDAEEDDIESTDTDDSTSVASSTKEDASEGDLEDEFTDSEELEEELEASSTDDSNSEELSDSEIADAEGTDTAGDTADTADTTDQSSEEGIDLADDDTESTTTASDESSKADESTLEDSTDDIAPPTMIRNIRYQAGENKIYIEGEGTLSYQSRENIAENQLVVEIPNAILADNLKWPFIMKDFDTQMAFLQADQKENNTVRVVVQVRKNASLPSVTVAESGALVISHNLVASATGGDTGEAGGIGIGDDGSTGGTDGTQAVLPAKTLEEFFLKTPKFQGRPISVHLQNVDIQDVLHFISDGTGLNMVVAEDVSGKITVKLRQVPWDQVLVTILKSKKLGYLREGNVIRIMTLSSLKEHQKEIQDMVRNQRVLEPMQVKVIPVVYAEAEQFKQQVDLFLSKNDKGEILGKSLVDQNTNSIIITDTQKVIKRVETLIKKLDHSPLQVMIEAKIVEARKTFTRNLGIGWKFRGTPLNLNIGGSSRLALNIQGGIDAFPTLFGQSRGRTVKTEGLQFSFAPVGTLDTVLDLSEAQNIVRVLSSPRVMVLNGEQATIRQSSETIDIATTSSGNTGQAVGTQARRNPIVMELKVKPKITVVGTVFMEITMQRDFPGSVADPGTGARPVNSRTASTKVLVNNGQTLVIGGIYQKDQTRGDEGVPLLKRIPIIKWLFNRFTSGETMNELLLFLTPHVMDFKSAQAQAHVVSPNL